MDVRVVLFDSAFDFAQAATSNGRKCFSNCVLFAFDFAHAATWWLSEAETTVAFDFAQAATRWLSEAETTVFQFLSLSSPYPLPILSLSSPYPLPINSCKIGTIEVEDIEGILRGR